MIQRYFFAKVCEKYRLCDSRTRVILPALVQENVFFALVSVLQLTK